MTGAIYVAGALDYETRRRVSSSFPHFVFFFVSVICLSLTTDVVVIVLAIYYIYDIRNGSTVQSTVKFILAYKLLYNSIRALIEWLQAVIHTYITARNMSEIDNLQGSHARV